MFSKSSSKKSSGLGLVEIALLLMMASLALIPLTQMLGKSEGGDGSSLTTLNRQRTRELVAANNIMERALSGEILTQNIANEGQLYNSIGNNAFNLNNVPVNGNEVYYPSKTGTYTYGDSTQGVRLKYRWTLSDTSYKKDEADLVNWDETANQESPEQCNPYNTYDLGTNACWGQITPLGNRIVKATLDVFDAYASPDAKPTYTFSTFLFGQGEVDIPETQRVGVAVVLDVSGSMGMGKSNYGRNYRRIFSPFLANRFEREDALPPGLNLTADDLDMFDDRKLDIVWNMPEDDPETPYDERFPGPGILKMPDIQRDDFEDEEAITDWLIALDNNRNRRRQQYDRYFDDLHGTDDYNPVTMERWRQHVVPRIPRIEAARSALLGFLVALEEDLELTQNTEMAFITFQSSNREKLEVPLESAEMTKDPANFNVKRPRFKKIRERFLWINRWDEKYGSGWRRRSIRADGGTNLRDGMELAVEELLSGDNLTQRFIIVLMDGDPNPNRGDNSRDANVDYAEYIFNKHKIQVYTIGFAGLSNQGKNMLQGMAEKSKGDFYYADDPEELRDIFVSISYKLRKELVLARVDRYNGALAGQLR